MEELTVRERIANFLEVPLAVEKVSWSPRSSQAISAQSIDGTLQLRLDHSIWSSALPRRLPLQLHRSPHQSIFRGLSDRVKPGPKSSTLPHPTAVPAFYPTHAAALHPNSGTHVRDGFQQDVPHGPRTGYHQALCDLQRFGGGCFPIGGGFPIY